MSDDREDPPEGERWLPEREGLEPGLMARMRLVDDDEEPRPPAAGEPEDPPG